MKTTSSVFRLAGVLFLASVTASLATAQDKPKTVWDGAYTEAQATRGTQSFIQQCSGCHSVEPTGQTPLVGNDFNRRFLQSTVSDVLRFVTLNMPQRAPGSLDPATYADIVAFIFKSNGFPAGAAAVGTPASADLLVAAKDGPTGLPDNAQAHLVGCLAKKGSDWVVTSSISPERPDRAGPEDATRSLGTREIKLMYVLTNMDSWGNARISVNGQLMGADAAQGINVMKVNKLADKCP